MSEGVKNRRTQLLALIEALERLIPLAAANRREPWLPDLDYCLRFAIHLKDTGFTQLDLNELSRNVTDVFRGGMGGFTDAFPTFEPDQFNEWSEAAFVRGRDLHLVEIEKPGQK